MSSIVSIDTRGYDISMGPGVLRVGGGGGLAGNVYINGNVGIGTSSPNARLDVNGAISTSGSITASGSIATNSLITSDGVISTRSSLISEPSTANTGHVRVFAQGSANYIQSGLTAISGSAAPLYFTDIYAANRWMTITSTGNVGIGTTTPTSKLDVNGTANISGLVSATGGLLQNRITLSTAAITPTDAFYGSLIVFQNTVTTDLGQFLPVAGVVSQIIIYNSCDVTQTINRSSTNVFVGCGYASTSISISLRPYDIVTLQSNGGGAWFLISHTNSVPANRTLISRKSNATQNITTANETTILFQTNNGSGGQTGIDYNAGVFTNNRGCTVVCNISGTLSYPLNGTGFRAVWVEHSSLGRISISSLTAVTTQPTCLIYSANLKLDNTQSFTIKGYQNSGGNLTISGNTSHPTTCTVLINDTC